MNKFIIFKQTNGSLGVILPTGILSIEETAQKDVPANCPYKIIDRSDLPEEAIYWDEFFDAVEFDFSKSNDELKLNLSKAKEISHEKRRAARSQDFQPWDVKATIPSEQAAAESERQKIRDKYAAMQENIDKAKSVQELSQLTPKV